MADLRPVIRVLFDEAHQEAWTVRPEVAAKMQPTHPADASYARAADLLRARRADVVVNEDATLEDWMLSEADVVVIAHPSAPKWEATTGVGDPILTRAELDALEAYVNAGGGLIVLGESEQDKYDNNLNELLRRFGVQIEHATVQDYDNNLNASTAWVRAHLGNGRRGADGDLLAGVSGAVFYRAGTLTVTHAGADFQVLARTAPTASAPNAPLALALRHGKGRVAVFADSDLFGDDCIGDLGHATFFTNVVAWAAQHAYATPAAPDRSEAEQDPAWAKLKTATDALRLLQAADGSIDMDKNDRAGVTALVRDMVDGIEGLAPRFPHEADYLRAAVNDLNHWDPATKPDFTAALDAFRPDLHRTDAIEHLVLFPMYLQNGSSRDTRFEAVLIRTPWPEWLADLERDRYDNAKFVPITLTDSTNGYDSECATLFPETVAVAGRPANHFGGIFCDREAERFRRVVSAAADTVGLNLPPDAAALLRSERLSLDTYVLWDLVHDRAHSRGDLPFDPFMIRQRMPYWMYSLEELRCDLTAFGEAVKLESEGMAFARNVQYAVLFDRIFRFPVTGPRVRNYDGLGGQLLFAYLHRHGFVHWTDNRLTVEWDRLAEGVGGLRTEVETLYREGIDRSKLAQWGAAHDLVARYVPAASGSTWTATARTYADVEDPRPYIDDVKPDEFPLSMFYTSLKAKLEPTLVRPPRATVAA
ncbi:DUF6421 family protein [Conexibacter woesei]|uniref:DUF6421 family protein n=1 Tax=Conexibacter woesei TaxID=191495 RepID=UPI000403BE9D|nr:DUF6421 family protein [Conexibacter woesei]